MTDKETNNSGTVKESKIDKELIKRIKEIQDLPDDVIYKFICAACSLSKTDFAKRFNIEK